MKKEFDISLLTSTELLDELQTRYTRLIFAGIKKSPDDGNNFHWFTQGGFVSDFGLLGMLKEEIKRMYNEHLAEGDKPTVTHDDNDEPL